MRCNECGGEISGGVCTVCGMAVTDNAEQIPAENSTYGGERNNYPYSAGLNYRPQNEPVSVARWLGRMFVSWIPFVGGLVYIIMLIVWACSDRFEETSKNWAIASIIMAAINIVVGISIVWMFMAIIGGILNDPGIQNELDMFMRTLPAY